MVTSIKSVEKESEGSSVGIKETDPRRGTKGLPLEDLQRVSPEQMASAYTAFANKGVRVQPRFVTKLWTQTGKSL